MCRTPLAATIALLAALSFTFAAPRMAQAGEPETSTLPAAAQGGDLAEPPAPAPEVHLNLIDKKLALSLAVDLEAQIAMAEFALKAINNDALRRFVADRMQSHRDFAARLDKLTDGHARSTLDRAARAIENDRSPDASQGKRFRLLSVRSATAMLARIRLEILQEYAAMRRAELADKNVDEFDLHYLRCDIVGQMQVLATLKVFEGQASADFAGVIHKAWSEAGRHYDDSRQLLKQLEESPLAGVEPAVPVSAPVSVETVSDSIVKP